MTMPLTDAAAERILQACLSQHSVNVSHLVRVAYAQSVITQAQLAALTSFLRTKNLIGDRELDKMVAGELNRRFEELTGPTLDAAPTIIRPLNGGG